MLLLLVKFAIFIVSITSCRGGVPPLTNITFGPVDPSIYTSPCGPQIYCLPTAGSQWLNGVENLLRWNYQYPTFLTEGYVNIKLYYEDDDYNPVQQWLNITNSKGLLTVVTTLTDNIRSGYPTTQNVTGKNFFFTVSTLNDSSSRIEKGSIFSIYDIRFPYVPHSNNVVNAPASTSTSTPSSKTEISKPSASSEPQEPNLPSNEHNGLSTGAIASITIGSILAFLIIGAILFVLRKRSNRQRRVGYTNEKMNPRYSDQNGSIYLQRGNTSASEVDSLSPLADTPDTPKRHSLRLTVKDAQLLAHHYRSMLTKKTWGSSGAESQGTSYSDELLRRELAAEGCDVRLVNNAPGIVIVNEDGIVSSEVLSVNPQVHEHESMDVELKK
ncbi:hypothetical protein K7432_002074 [Basidiobolus ranarum]|uniref:Uncharacterized protein n=1 Tax=Basidiobolus ranarum TaxID=34480 RepID=A0ABR2W8E6_9FUNG